MKTLKYMLQHAMKIAMEPDAIVAVFFSSYMRTREEFLKMRETLPIEFTNNRRDFSFIHANGGKVRFCWINETNITDHSGNQYSHVFVPEGLDWASQMYVETRVRTTKKFTAPIGMYTPYGAKVVVDY